MRLPTLTTAIAVAASVLVALVMVGPISSASADTTFTVKSDADTDGTTCGAADCTLRQAINAANAASGKDTIVFDLGPSATITLGSQLPNITDAAGLTIDGGSASITVSGNEQVRVFWVDSEAKLALKNLTVADGFVPGNLNSGGGVEMLRRSTLEVTDSTFSGNRARSGGGIANLDGTLTVTNSTFSNNIADDDDERSTDWGGGIFINGGTTTISGSTFSGNSADQGGGFFIDGGGAIEVSNSTFSENSASNRGGGIDVSGAPIAFSRATLKNTIVANSPSGGNCFINSSGGTLTDGGYNMEDGTTCGFGTANNSKPSTDPKLDPEGLQDNGGPTKTIALQAASPAIDKGKAFGSTTDQRGEVRPQDDPAIQNATGGDGSDIGAFEVEKTAPTLTSIDDGDADDQVARGEVLSYTLTFSEDIDQSTLTADDLDNAGTASISIGAITESSTTPGLFTVEVTPTTLGTLVLRVKDAAQVEDVAGNELETPVQDDTTVTVVNNKPVANDDAYEVDEDHTLTVPAQEGVLDNDTDPDSADTLEAVQVNGPSHGSLTLEEDGSFTYTPEENFSGEDSFTYEATDDNGGTDTATVEITVEPLDDPPVAQKDTYTIAKGSKSLSVPASSGVLANDSDPEGDTLTVSLVRGPQVGMLKLRRDGSFVYKMPKRTFERNEFHGVAFVYEVSDGQGGTDTAKATINKE